MSDYEDKVREHTFDGIQEYDNKLPNWWLWTLYGTIAFALVYWLVVQTIAITRTPAEQLEADMAAAAEAQLARMAEGGVTNQSLHVVAEIPARVAEGREIFLQYCAVCHTETGGGSVGPNLTDHYWLHGPHPMDQYEVVTNGVPAKGMAAWGNQLGPTRVESVVAYLLTIRGTQVQGGKEPQGDYFDPEEVAAAEAAEAAEAAAAGSTAAAEAAPEAAAADEAPGEAASQ
jgi:cytochrome c oxidase cbb3-type subunit 3